MRESGFELLLNSEKRIRLLDNSEISIFGLDDILLGKPKIKETLQRARKNIYNIVLVHEPDIAPQIATYPVNLQLSGHSHGGQVQIPFLGAIITPALAKNYVEGFYRIQDLALYVNRGLGRTRVPFRFMAKPEITILRSNIRNHSPIFLQILSCTRSSMFHLPYDKSESNKGGLFMYPYYQPIPVRSAPIGPVGDSRFFPFLASHF